MPMKLWSSLKDGNLSDGLNKESFLKLKDKESTPVWSGITSLWLEWIALIPKMNIKKNLWSLIMSWIMDNSRKFKDSMEEELSLSFKLFFIILVVTSFQPVNIHSHLALKLASIILPHSWTSQKIVKEKVE